MKRALALLLTAVCILTLVSCSDSSPKAEEVEPYTIRVYSNSNSGGRAQWLIDAAAEAGFTVSIDDETVVSGDTAVLDAANENMDGDILFGMNETRWGQVVDGEYENLSLIEWRPDWAFDVEQYTFFRRAYGLVVQNVLMLYRNDALGTRGQQLHFEHWADVVDSGYTWYRPNKVGGTTNANINAMLLYPFINSASPAGGVSIEGWKTLWRFCNQGISGPGSDYQYGFLPLNRGDVQISEFYSSALYGQIAAAEDTSAVPLRGTLEPENWSLVDIDDGTYYIAEYIGILDKEGRTSAQTQRVIDFAQWFGSAETQAAWGREFDTYPCNSKAAQLLYPNGAPDIYTLPNIALAVVPGAGVTYATYVAYYADQWTNIMTNLGFYWADPDDAPEEPDWDNLDWSTLVRPAA